MNANIEIQDLERLCAHYQTMVDYCSDVIKQLTGCTPDHFTFTFSIHETPIVSIPISEEDGHFCLGVFMAWHQYYSKQLRTKAVLLHNLTARVAV